MPSQTLVKLDFQEKLIQSGKKENTDALLKRLKTLHEKLKNLEQDLTDTRSLEPVRKPLISQTILHHTNRGVKAYAACCLADLLRLYAPDAPYSGDELRDIFQFFSHQLLLNLKPPAASVRPLQPSRSKSNTTTADSQSQAASQRVTDVPYYTEYCYLLESLATIKSIVLACDVPDGDDLVTGFFEGFAEIVRPDMSKNIIRHLVNILVAILDESASVPSGVMDCIVGQFESFAEKPETPSFQLIADVCNRCPDRLQRAIFAHFSEIQLQHGRNPDSADLATLTASHRLMLQIYRFCPGLLLNVIPLLEENLKAADEVPLRQLSTQTLGTMFGERPIVGGGVADLAKAYPSAWRAWVGRKVDKALGVRLAWVEGAKGVLSNHPELRKELEGDLTDRIQDSDERVRAAICKVIGGLDYETALHHVSEKTLKAVGARMSDKKGAVRVEAANALARLWTAAYSEIELNEPEAISQFAWIPAAMLHCLTKKDVTLELRGQITAIFKTSVIPLPANADNEEAWVERLLLVGSHLDDQAFRSLERLTGLIGYARGSSPYRAFVHFCEQYNGGTIDSDADSKMIKANLDFIINAISHTIFTEPEKARKDLDAFAENNDQRIYKLFKTCCEPSTDLRTLLKARNEFLRRVEQSHDSLLDTLTTLLDVASWTIVNQSSISPLLKALQKPGSGAQGEKRADVAYRLLRLMAKECAPMFSSHVAELLQVAVGERKNAKLREVGLQALAQVVKLEKELAPDDIGKARKIMNIAIEGTPRQAKFAARFVAYSKHKDLASELIDTILTELTDKDMARLPTYLRALAELAVSAAEAFEDKSEEIHRYVMREVIFAKSPSAGEGEEDVWTDPSTLSPLDQAKLAALRIITHRVLIHARDASVVDLFKPVGETLGAILKNEGAVNETTGESGKVRPHFRLRAALCLTKLARCKALDKALGPMFEDVPGMLQDPCYEVRHAFLMKLAEILPAQKMLPRWNMLPCLVALDPEQDLVVLARSIMVNNAQQATSFPIQTRIDRVEMPLARLLLLLTHHPDCTFDPSGLKDMARFIEMYVDCVMTRDNASLLYHIAGKVKTVRDARAEYEDEHPRLEEVTEDNRNLWTLSELAQLIIKNMTDARGWSLNSYPGKVKLPSDIYHNLRSIDEANRNSRIAYLDDEMAQWVKGLGRRSNVTAGPSRRADPPSSPKKRVRSTGKAARKKQRRASKSDDEDEDEDSSDEDDEDDEEADDAEESEEEEAGEGVMGRGGKRGAKTKAKRAVAGKKARKLKKARAASSSDGMEVDGEESELTDLED